jgi:hypothetical protein
MLHVEQRLEDDVTRVAGSPDRVERSAAGVEIVDLKTGWRVGDELKPAHRRQLLLYAFLWHAAHDEWPARASIQRLDGTRITLDVDPSESRLEAKQASQALARFNGLVISGVNPDILAQPSEGACRDCDYCGACDGFLRQPSDNWRGRRRTFAGTVVRIEEMRLGSAIDLDDVVGGCSAASARVVAPGSVAEAPVGSSCVVAGAIPVAEAEFKVDWESGLFVREG